MRKYVVSPVNGFAVARSHENGMEVLVFGRKGCAVPDSCSEASFDDLMGVMEFLGVYVEHGWSEHAGRNLWLVSLDL